MARADFARSADSQKGNRSACTFEFGYVCCIGRPPRKKALVLRHLVKTRALFCPRMAGAFADVDALVCYAMKANSDDSAPRNRSGPRLPAESCALGFEQAFATVALASRKTGATCEALKLWVVPHRKLQVKKRIPKEDLAKNMPLRHNLSQRQLRCDVAQGPLSTFG